MNVIMVLAFSRIQNVPKIIPSFERSKTGLGGTFKVIPVCDTVDQVTAWNGVAWAEPVLALKKPGWFMGHWLLNVAWDQLFPLPDPINTIVAVTTDDDDLPDAYFAHLEAAFDHHNKPFVMVTSMRRWMHGPNPIDFLTADAGHMRVCAAGFEMIYLRGDIAGHYRFANNPIADGFLIEQLYKELASGFVFLPHLVTEWNRF